MNIIEYGINPANRTFDPKEGKHDTVLLRQDHLRKIISNEVGEVSLRVSCFMHVMMKIAASHKFAFISNYKDLAQELNIDVRNLRKYMKHYVEKKSLEVVKLKAKDCESSDEYLFLMGSEYEGFLWESNFYHKKLPDYCQPFTAIEEDQRGCDNPQVEGKGVEVTPQRGCDNPQEIDQNSQNTDEIAENRSPVFFMTSFKNLSSEEKVLKISFNKDLSIKNLAKKWVVEERKMRSLWGAVEGHGHSHSGAPIKKDVGAYLWKYYPDALKFFQSKSMHSAVKREEPLEEATLPPTDWINPHLRKRPTGSSSNWTESENEIVRRNRENFQIQKEEMLRSASL